MIFGAVFAAQPTPAQNGPEATIEASPAAQATNASATATPGPSPSPFPGQGEGTSTSVAGPILKVPLTIDYITLSEALKRQAYTDDGKARLWNGSDRCQYLYAENPVFSHDSGAVVLESNGTLSLGVAVASTCVSPINWKGIIQVKAEPYIALPLMLKFHVRDINVLNDKHDKTLIAGKGFDLVKSHFIPKIEEFGFDLNPATEQLAALAQDAAPAEVAERVKATLATLTAESTVLATPDGVRATLEMRLPTFATPTASPAPAKLTAEEIAAFEKQLNQFDAFLVFAVKQLGSTNTDPKFRRDLLSLLIDSRYRLVQALSDPSSGGADPVRILFLKQWMRLGEIIRDAARRHALGNRSLEFLSFISAADALLALDDAAPALGMRISADDLRRFAKIMAPQATTDPLLFNFEEDKELRQMFGVPEPMESSDFSEESELVAATSTPGATPSPSPGAPSPTAIPETPMPTSTPGPTSWIEWPLSLISPTMAWGATDVPAAEDRFSKLRELAHKLRRAVVNDDNADSYRTDIGALIELSGEREIATEQVDAAHRPLYKNLVKAVAWQESCWRQFVVKGGRIVFLESSTHDIGLMQVNKYVWRGFYSIERLEWDILYNATAGMEILARLMDDIADKGGAASPGKPEELARSIYAAYNGGPSAYRRWRGREPRETRAIDSAFWAKYQATARGQSFDIMTCATQWGHAPSE